jgi:hypothetical protein
MEVAVRIGQRLVQTASWQGEVCCWPGRSPEPSGNLYQGTAGIALFLGALFRATGEAAFRKTATAAIRHATTVGELIPEASLGFHTGRTGIAWVLAHLAEWLERPSLYRPAAHLVTGIGLHLHDDDALDVVTGAAGAIPALLDLSSRLEKPVWMAWAERLGEHLLQHVHPEPVGWSWRTLSFPCVRHLTGLAHGASGIGWAFLELYRATGASAWLYAAEQAFCYERAWYDAQARNWPDFRHLELGGAYFGDAADAVLERIRTGTLPSYQPRHTWAWCYGAPGIGLVRLRACEIYPHAVYEQEARLAVASIRDSLQTPGQNFSLCHGLAGNAEALHEGAVVLGDAALQGAALAVAEAGACCYESMGQPWPCGGSDAAPEPGLMLGEAGIGYFYLRLACSDLPSVLLPRPSTPAAAPLPWNHAPLQRMTALLHFPRAVRIVEAATQAAFAASEPGPVAIGSHESHAVYLLRRLQQVDVGRAQPCLADACALDAAVFDHMQHLNDFTEEWQVLSTRPPFEQVVQAHWPLVAAPATRVWTQSYAWELWLADAAAEEPQLQETACVVYRQGNRIRVRPASGLVVAIVGALARPQTVHHVVAAVMDGAAPQGGVRAVLAQVRQLYEADLLRAMPGAAQAVAMDEAVLQENG